MKHLYAADAKKTYPLVVEFRGRLKIMDRNSEYIKDRHRMMREAYLLTAKDNFDDFCIFLEWNRPLKERFYLPRREKLLRLAQALQRLADDEIDLLCISLPPGVGKTTLAIFFICWLAGKYPQEPILTGSHSTSFLDGVYSECLRVITDKDVYLWSEVFPTVKLVSTNAKDLRIDLGIGKRFETLEFTSVGSGNAGKVRAFQLLYCDDIVDGFETATSRDRLDKLWAQYTTDLRQRKIGKKCKELHIATRWSLYDPIGRLHEAYSNDDRAEFISIPALDENDESNFDYPFGLGYSSQKLREQRTMMTDVLWNALYMNAPIEGEGVLYDSKLLRRYFGELPDGEPDAVVGVCDTKTTGSDYCVLLLAWQYGEDFYIHDCICENYAPNIVENSLEGKIAERDPHIVQFESNVAGGKLASDLQEKLKKRGCKTKITTKWTQQNKETKIQVNAPWIIQHCVFLDESAYNGSSELKEYRIMMSQMTTYTLYGKNKHDDVVDALAQLALFAQSSQRSHNAVVMQRPF